jgi:hypothetical protein
MTKNTPEKELEPFTASFLLQEFRKDMRHIDQKFDHMDKKFLHIDGKFDRIDEKFDRIDEKFDRMGAKIDNNFKWLVGILLVGIALPFVKSFFM